MINRRFAGGVLLVVGGTAEAIRMIVGMSLSVAAAPATIILIGIVPTLIISLGCMLLGLSVSGRARTGFFVAAAGGLLLATTNAVQVASGSPLGPAPSQIVSALNVLTLVVGAVLVLSDDTLNGPARWALGVPAVVAVVLIAAIFIIPWGGLLVLAPLAYVAAGAIFIRAARDVGQPQVAQV